MCPPLGEVYEFGKLINSCILEGDIESLPLHMTEMEAKGYKIIYKVIPKEEYERTRIDDYWDKAVLDSERYWEKMAYQGTLIFEPMLTLKTYPIVFRNKQHPITDAHSYILIKSLALHNNLCIVGFNYDRRKDAEPCKDANIYVMLVYAPERLWPLRNMAK